MKLSQFPIFAIILLVIGLILYLIFVSLLKQTKNIKKLTQKGNLAMADVISISKINSNKSRVTQLLMLVELKNEGGRVRRVEIRHPVDQGAIPRIGDRVFVIIDPRDSNNVVLAPVPPGSISEH